MQGRKDPGASFVVDGWGPVFSSRVAEECNRVSGQESTEEEERLHADLERTAKERELGFRKQFEVLPPANMAPQSKDVVEARWVLTSRNAGGTKTVTARLAAKGYQ